MRCVNRSPFAYWSQTFGDLSLKTICRIWSEDVYISSFQHFLVSWGRLEGIGRSDVSFLGIWVESHSASRACHFDVDIFSFVWCVGVAQLFSGSLPNFSLCNCIFGTSIGKRNKEESYVAILVDFSLTIVFGIVFINCMIS